MGAAGTLAPALLVLASLPAWASAKERQTCSSKLPGDYSYEACGAFCKAEKKSSHCKYCKCKACQFCPAPEPAAAAAVPEPEPVETKLQQRKNKKKRNKNKRQAEQVPVIAPPVAEAAALPKGEPKAELTPASSSGSSKRQQCISGIKGDFQYETCGAFCKEAKAVNHCRFCKCKSCSYCSGKQSSSDAPAAAVPAASQTAQLPGTMPPPRTSSTPAAAGESGAPQASPTSTAELVGGLGGALVAVLVVLCIVARHYRDGVVAAVFAQMGCCPRRPLLEEQSLVNADDDFFADDGPSSQSRQAVDDAFRSVEKLEESLHRGKREGGGAPS